MLLLAGLNPQRGMAKPILPPVLVVLALASLVLFLIHSPPAPEYNISICQSLRYFGNAVLKLSHMSDPPLCGRERDVVRDRGGARRPGVGKTQQYSTTAAGNSGREARRGDGAACE